MSRTNVFTLIATLLLGVLLFTITRYTEKLPQPPPAATIREPATAKPSESGRGPAEQRRIGDLPSVSTHDELLDFLHARNVDVRTTMRESAAWRQARGFYEPDELFGITENDAPGAVFRTLNEDTLSSLADTGRGAAAQELAARVAFSDPFAALDLYRSAAGRGSVNAVLRMAALLESLLDPATEDFAADSDYLLQLAELRRVHEHPKFLAFAHAVAAVRDGGLPIVDGEVFAWLQRMSSDLSVSEVSAACERSSELFLEFGVSRRQNGIQPISTTPPPVFLSIPDIEKLLPCQKTAYPIIQLLDLSQCSQSLVTNDRDEPMNLFVCTND